MFLSQTSGSGRGPGDDFWYSPIFSRGASHVSSITATRLSTVYICGKILAETLGQVPCILYRRLARGKQRATDHPLYALIHDAPNEWQTAFEWKAMLEWHLAFRGNAYCEIVVSRGTGRVEQLIPLHPDRCRVERGPSGLPRLRVRDDINGVERVLVHGEYLHLKGLTTDGLIGFNPIEAQRESLGEALSAQSYSTRTLDNDARPGGIIEWEGHFKTDDDARKFRNSWQEAQAGVNRGKTAVLQQGMSYKDIGLKPADLQFMELRKMKQTEICGMFRIPPHMAGLLERSTNNNIEHQGIEFTTRTMMPWFVNWEQTLSMALIDRENDPDLFFQFLAEALMRGDANARKEIYNEGIQDGWLTRNEVREAEDRNPLPGLDEPLEPMNMRRAGQLGGTLPGKGGRTPGARSDTPADTRADDRAAAIERAAAERVLGRELSALARLAQREGDFGPAAFAAVQTFYGEHVDFVAAALAVDRDTAGRYCLARIEHARGSGTVNAFINQSRESGPAGLLAALHLTPEPDHEP